MPRSEEANARIREDQRRRILAAAERVFARKGLAAAKMSDIARAAGEVVAGDADQLASLFGSLIEGLAVDAAFIHPQRPLPDAAAVLRMLKA